MKETVRKERKVANKKYFQIHIQNKAKKSFWFSLLLLAILAYVFVETLARK